MKTVVWPFRGKWGNPDCKHSDLRNGEEPQEHEGTGVSVIQVTMDNGMSPFESPAVVTAFFYIYPPFFKLPPRIPPNTSTFKEQNK